MSGSANLEGQPLANSMTSLNGTHLVARQETTQRACSHAGLSSKACPLVASSTVMSITIKPTQVEFQPIPIISSTSLVSSITSTFASQSRFSPSAQTDCPRSTYQLSKSFRPSLFIY